MGFNAAKIDTEPGARTKLHQFSILVFEEYILSTRYFFVKVINYEDFGLQK
jgi:hypothetical protein